VQPRPARRFSSREQELTGVSQAIGEDPGLEKFDEITFTEVLNRGLKVMDAQLLAMCRDNSIPIIVFNMTREGDLLRVVNGERDRNDCKGVKAWKKNYVLLRRPHEESNRTSQARPVDDSDRRASASLLDMVRVNYYGAMTPLNHIANISVPDSKTILIQPFQQNLISDIER